jgi:hypothetical protein
VICRNAPRCDAHFLNPLTSKALAESCAQSLRLRLAPNEQCYLRLKLDPHDILALGQT